MWCMRLPLCLSSSCSAPPCSARLPDGDPTCGPCLVGRAACGRRGGVSPTPPLLAALGTRASAAGAAAASPPPNSTSSGWHRRRQPQKPHILCVCLCLVWGGACCPLWGFMRSRFWGVLFLGGAFPRFGQAADGLPARRVCRGFWERLRRSSALSGSHGRPRHGHDHHRTRPGVEGQPPRLVPASRAQRGRHEAGHGEGGRGGRHHRAALGGFGIAARVGIFCFCWSSFDT